jgi:hypothetical protein
VESGRICSLPAPNDDTQQENTVMPTKNFQAQLSRWEVLNTNLKTHLDLLPHLQPGQLELEQKIAEGKVFAAQQSQLTAALREVIVRRQDLEKATNHLREFLDSGLRHAFGTTSQKLHEFEIRPRIRRSKAATVPEPLEAGPGVTQQGNRSQQ